MPLQIIRSDITKVKADAIVNTANPEVAIGAGVDLAIYEAAGEDQLLAERAKIGPMEPGQAAATDAFALDAKYIIHTVGPAWLGGDHGEREAVASCYKESLRIADELDCESVAFPLISTGTYGFPKDEALNIAVREISSFLFTHDMTVYMVVYDKESFVISGKAFADIKSYIEEKDVVVHKMYGNVTGAGLNASARVSSLSRKDRAARKAAARKAMLEEELAKESQENDPGHFALKNNAVDADEATYYADYYAPESFDFFPDSTISTGSLEDELNKRKQEETFQEMLFRLIDRKGMDDPEVYKKANLDRKLFSKIRSNKYYQPKKNTALALAVALELNMDETIDLLQRAGLALSPSSRFDFIVGYCIEHKIYNIFEINNYLFELEEQILA